MDKSVVGVKIYGQEYTVSGDKSREYIIKVADYVDQNMREIAAAAAGFPVSSLAVLASVNIAQSLDKIVSVDMTNRFEIYFWYEDRFYVYMGTVDDAEIKTAFLVKVIEMLGNNRGNIDVSDTREASFSIFE